MTEQTPEKRRARGGGGAYQVLAVDGGQLRGQHDGGDEGEQGGEGVEGQQGDGHGDEGDEVRDEAVQHCEPTDRAHEHGEVQGRGADVPAVGRHHVAEQRRREEHPEELQEPQD